MRGLALFSLLHTSSLTKAYELGDAICMNQGSTLPSAHRYRDGRKCSMLDHLIHKSLSDPRVAVFLQLPTAARTSALATILDSDEGKNFRALGPGAVCRVAAGGARSHVVLWLASLDPAARA